MSNRRQGKMWRLEAMRERKKRRARRDIALPGKKASLRAGGKELRGILELTARGNGFVRVLGEERADKDIFIARARLGDAFHGDTVIVQLSGMTRGRREGRIIRVETRGLTSICGLYSSQRGGGGQVVPDNEHLPFTLKIAPEDAPSADADGMAVVAALAGYGDASGQVRGRILEVLGDPYDARVQTRMAALTAGLNEAFPEEALAEAAALSEIVACEAGREDLRGLLHVTIDGEDARDFDDAICVEKAGAGYTLYVSIADVGCYVRPGQAIDRAAYERGNSVYLPGRVLPMLPERLADDLCSLMPGKSRPAFTAILHFDEQGRREGARFTKSLITSRRRCTYTEVDRLFQGDAGVAREYGQLAIMLASARSLSACLRARRLERGGLEFDAPETETVLLGGQVALMRRAVHNEAHLLIEDCMLAANEAVAETLAQAKRPVLYRIHDKPDPKKFETFSEAVRSLGLNLPEAEPNAFWIAKALKSATQRPAAYLLNNLLLRALAQARYSPDNTGHFGLGVCCYLHFTSPIRRYPDLIAHRVLAALLMGEGRGQTQVVPEAEIDLNTASLHLSQCERKAVSAERDALSRMALLFLHNKIGEIFPAVISGVSASGLYLELESSGISGFMPVTCLPDDDYLYDAVRFRLIGERRGRIFQLGDCVSARLEEARLEQKRLIFSLPAQSRRKNDGQ